MSDLATNDTQRTGSEMRDENAPYWIRTEAKRIRARPTYDILYIAVKDRLRPM